MPEDARNSSKFAAALKEFFGLLIKQAKVASKRKLSPEASKQLNRLLGKIQREITSRRALTGMNEAVTSETLNPDDHKIIGYLVHEMELFKTISKDSKDGSAVSTGKSIKDSVEKLVKLPKWLKKLLGVLNELLSIVQGGA